MPGWNRPDDKAHDYTPINPYAYCAGDPVNNSDTDGRLIEFSKGSSNEFKEKFYEAFYALLNVGAHENILMSMLDTRYTITIYELSNDSPKGSRYSSGSLYWAPNQALLTETNDGKNYILSPMEILQHEFDHGIDDKLNHELHLDNSKKGSDKDFETKEEKRVIMGSEQSTAQKLGKLNEGQITRTNHSFGVLIITEGPTSDLYVRTLGRSY